MLNIGVSLEFFPWKVEICGHCKEQYSPLFVYTMWEGWRSTWLRIKMKDKVLSLRWWEWTQTEKCTQTEWALSCREWWFTDVLTAYQVQLWQEQGSAPREPRGRHPNTSSPVFFLTPILFHWLHGFTADLYQCECYNLSPFSSSLPSGFPNWCKRQSVDTSSLHRECWAVSIMCFAQVWITLVAEIWAYFL